MTGKTTDIRKPISNINQWMKSILQKQKVKLITEKTTRKIKTTMRQITRVVSKEAFFDATRTFD